MTLHIVLLNPPLEPPLYAEHSGRKIIIGRSREAHICLPDRSVAPHHASIRKRGAQYLLVDEASGLLTAVHDGEDWTHLNPHAPRVLASGTKVRIGSVDLRIDFSAQHLAQNDPRGQSAQLAIDLVGSALGSHLGRAPSQAEVQSALEEILALPTLPPESARPEPPPAAARKKERDPQKVDQSFELAIVLLALVLLALSIWGYLRLAPA